MSHFHNVVSANHLCNYPYTILLLFHIKLINCCLILTEFSKNLALCSWLVLRQPIHQMDRSGVLSVPRIKVAQGPDDNPWTQPHSQHCLSTELIGCNLNYESVRKFWKLNFDTKFLTACSCNRRRIRELYCSSHENNCWTTKCLTCIKVGDVSGLAKKIKGTGHER